MFKDGVVELKSVTGTKRLIAAAKDIEAVVKLHKVTLIPLSEQPGAATLVLYDESTDQAIPYHMCLSDKEVADYVRTNENQS